MEAIMISGKPRWTALIMNGDKIDEIRKNKNLYKAVQKLIDKYGYADIYWYCSKDKSLIYTDGTDGKGDYVDWQYYESYKGDKNDIGSGKVVFKFRCYKVEEIAPRIYSVCQYPYTTTLDDYDLLETSCLEVDELESYLGNKTGYAIHISDLQIFNKPKELDEFWVCRDTYGRPTDGRSEDTYLDTLAGAPQNWCYIFLD